MSVRMKTAGCSPGWMTDRLCSAGVMEVDILEFRVPVENNKTLFVWDIQPSQSEAQIYVSPLGFRSVTPPGSGVQV